MSLEVTVLMPVYNGEKYLAEAIKSILNQTFTNFEFIIIDDGSSDKSLEIIKSFDDARITLLRNGENLGLVKTLNKGIKVATGKYIVRMDADDISLPERIKKQVVFMESHPEIAVSGSWVRIIKNVETGEVWNFPGDPAEIKCKLLFNNVLVHSSVIIRKEYFIQRNLNYESYFGQAEDYNTWVRVAAVSLITNIPEVLHLYRVHSLQAMQVYFEDVSRDARRIKTGQLNKLGIEPNDRETAIHEALCTNRYRQDRVFVRQVEHWLLKISMSNKIAGIYSEDALAKVVGEYWENTCQNAKRQGFWIIYKYTFSPLSSTLGLTASQKIRFVVGFGKSAIKKVKSRLSGN